MVQAFPVPEGTPVLRVLLRRHRTSTEHLPSALPLLLWQTNRTAYSFSALLFPHFLNFSKPLFPYYPSPDLFVNSWLKFFRFQTAQPKNCHPDRLRLPGQAEKASSPMSAPSRCRHGTFSYPKYVHRWQGAAHWTLYQKGAFRANFHIYEWSFDRACGILGLVQQIGIYGGKHAR